MAGEGSIYRNVGSLNIPDLTHHDDVRCLTQHGPQGGRKGHPNVRFDHDLVNARQLILDGILHRDDLAVRLVDEIESRIKGGRLARSGGAGDEEDAVGLGDAVTNAGVHFLGDVKGLQRGELLVGGVEEAEHD